MTITAFMAATVPRPAPFAGAAAPVTPVTAVQLAHTDAAFPVRSAVRLQAPRGTGSRLSGQCVRPVQAG